MKVELEPLEGKYYGTIINTEHGHIEIWFHGDFIPSDRELASCGFTRKDWDENILIDDGWGGKEKIRSSDLIDSGHYENQITYRTALKIVDALKDID